MIELRKEIFHFDKLNENIIQFSISNLNSDFDLKSDIPLKYNKSKKIL